MADGVDGLKKELAERWPNPPRVPSLERLGRGRAAFKLDVTPHHEARRADPPGFYAGPRYRRMQDGRRVAGDACSLCGGDWISRSKRSHGCRMPACRVKHYEGKLATLTVINGQLQEENDDLRDELEKAQEPK